MANFYSNFGNVGSPQNTTLLDQNNLTPVRVLDVIVDESHPDYYNYGGASSIGIIKYTSMDRIVTARNLSDLYIAYPLNPTFRSLPLVNEIVLVIKAPNEDVANVKGTSTSTYYTTIVALWNHPTHNKAPNSIGPVAKDTSGFPDISNVNPLQPFPGDTIIQGRLGQSIRLGGVKSKKNIFSDGSNNGAPFMLITNGQKDVGIGIDPTVEDINEDPSSIYLVSNHRIPLKQSRDKISAIRRKPDLADKYKGSQVVINGGRLFFNAKDENIGFSSKGTFYASSERIGLDAEEEIGLDAKKIYLGVGSLRELEPIPKGDTLVNILNRLIGVLELIGSGFQNTNIAAGGGPDLGLLSQATAINQLLVGIRSDVIKIKSKKVFTE